MTIEKLFGDGSKEEKFFEELKRRREMLSMSTRRRVVWLIGEREENKEVLVKDAEYLKVTPVVVRQVSSKLTGYNYEPALLVTFERGEETKTLGYVSIYYKGFGLVEVDDLSEILSSDGIVYDEESDSFIRDSYLQS